LQDGLVRVFGGPRVCEGAGGVGVCGGDIDACGPLICLASWGLEELLLSGG
jgi:hypothetical protein